MPGDPAPGAGLLRGLWRRMEASPLTAPASSSCFSVPSGTSTACPTEIRGQQNSLPG